MYERSHNRLTNRDRRQFNFVYLCNHTFSRRYWTSSWIDFRAGCEMTTLISVVEDLSLVVAFLFCCLLILLFVALPFILLWGLFLSLRESAKNDRKKRNEALAELIARKIKGDK